MITRKIDSVIRDFFETTNMALLITGARQIGKTHSIREFGKTFKTFIEINFLENPQARQLFSKPMQASEILEALTILVDKPFIKGETLIFFDEVQLCPEIVTEIKFLVDEGSYRYILSGSLLGVELKSLRSVPVGYMGIEEMYPLDFEEFITAVGVNDVVIKKLKEAWETRQPIEDYLHEKMMKLFRLYLIVGGMPAAVREYVQTSNFQNVIREQNAILELYKKDISQYDNQKKLNILSTFNLIPPELNSKNKRFILKNLNEHAKFNRYEDTFLWLTDAGVAIPVYNVEEPKYPLLLARSRNLFKLFQNDIGLLGVQYSNGIQLKLLQGDDAINFGAIYENVVAQELIAHGLRPYYYNNKKRGELDFVVELGEKILPIEVKSGKDYATHRALSNIMDCENYDLPQAIVFTNDNLSQNGALLYAPIYMVMFLQREAPSLTTYKIDLSDINGSAV